MFYGYQDKTKQGPTWPYSPLASLCIAVIYILPLAAWYVFISKYTAGLSYGTLSIGESVSTRNGFGHFMYDVFPNACLTVGNFLLTTLVLYSAYAVTAVLYWFALMLGIYFFDEWIDSEPETVQVKVRGNTIRTIETVRFPMARRPEYTWKDSL